MLELLARPAKDAVEQSDYCSKRDRGVLRVGLVGVNELRSSSSRPRSFELSASRSATAMPSSAFVALSFGGSNRPSKLL
jgi:hypothetical protein